MEKIKILVLDAFTNGHEAALAFIESEGWLACDCSIVFCGTHAQIFEQLVKGPAYAVVPIHNSIAGEVTEVTQVLKTVRESGYDIEEVGRFDIPIVHYLLAKEHITNPKELGFVLSHEKAIQQCGKFLDSIDIPVEGRHTSTSTGNAAKQIARLESGSNVGAIAPKAAAQEYGLKILAEGIQDTKDNKTTFILLRNKALIKKVTVGIIGVNGLFGQTLERFFKEVGCDVVGSDLDTTMNNYHVVKKADVVIFSVPIDVTTNVIHDVRAHIREDQLLMDVTSVKEPAIKAMLQSQAQVVGLHPMFRPGVPFDGQTVVVCLARLNDPKWKNWVVNVLSATGAKIKWSTAKEHDEYMTTVQAVPHLANLTSALLMLESGISPKESLDFTSPFYRVMFSLMGRLVSQNPTLYASIAMENPGTVAALERRIEIEQKLLQIIRHKDQEAFEELFKKARDHFGGDVTKEANQLFIRLLAVLNTLYGENSVLLEFPKKDSQPGLLERVLGVFSRRNINLTGINSVTLDDQTLQFTISFDQSRTSDEVRRALEEIQDWKDIKVEVLK